ncbi:PP2C family protein-serine/threonine phosphatase [Alkalilacustris brevis]|uniref:PP2C family protein-serine/threonine phosphatase n=1 Tax=Alkalilacustris brevis TaxID=2026338 RepID=UPI000E0D1271|nr:fused response regulator/phosphatase [Alkalilacustris brevis]
MLVVDDSALQRRVASVLLRRWGYAVHEATSGEEALRLCSEQRVDIVLSDWVMPGMSGLEFCRAFRALPRDSYGYFILVTSNRDKGAVAKGLKEGADDFLRKPVSPEELRARIIAGERILRMEAELMQKNRLVSDTLYALQQIHDSIDRDLAQARQLQQSLVRRRQHDFGLAKVSLLLRPSGHVGGDLVGFFPIAQARVGLFALDVSGHGVTSAILAARLAGLFSGAVPEQNIALTPGAKGQHHARAPESVAMQMNRLILDEVESEHYCTLLYADADLATGRVRMVQAGHPFPALLRKDGRVEFPGRGGFPAGLIENASYEGFEVDLSPGDRLLIVSDGVTECADPYGHELGEAGLREIMQDIAGRRGEDFHEALIDALARHAGTPEFSDDVSAVLLEYGGPTAS